MTDRIDPKRRSANMAAIKAKNTGPEVAVRKVLHASGFRFRLHRADLPGHPDIVLPKYNTAVFVHGCFWHKHPGCTEATTPKSNTDYWVKKLNRNAERDISNRKALEELGWRVYVIWECSLRRGGRWANDFKKFIDGQSD